MVNFLTNVAIKENKNIVKKTILGTLWDDIGWDGIANEGGVKLKFGKKPEKLIKRIIEMSTVKGDLVLDYHLGSGTTIAVAHKMGRKYIGIEQMDYGKNDSTVRLQNVINNDQSGISKTIKWKGGGSFVYFELAKNNYKYVDLINNAKSSKDLISVWDALNTNPFISFKVNTLFFTDFRIQQYRKYN